MGGLLALDLSLSTGWAAGEPTTGFPAAGLWPLPSGKENFHRALTILRKAVHYEVRTRRIAFVYIESSMDKIDRFHGRYADVLLLSLQAVAGEAATEAGAEVRMAAPATWRKTFIGRGDLPGEDAKAAALKLCERFRWPTRGDHNIAEACGLWFHGMAKEYPRWNPAKAA